MNGADLDLPLASRAELDLQRRLARCRRHYVGNALQARLDIAQAAPDVDLELSLAWDGLPCAFSARPRRWPAGSRRTCRRQPSPACRRPATGLAGARRQRLSRPGLVRPEPGATTRCDGPAPEPGTRRPAPGALARRRSRDAAGTPAAAPLDATPGHTAAPVAAMARPAAGRQRAAHPGARRPVAAACRSSPRRSAAGVLEGRPWARCQLHSTQLELLDMHDTLPRRQRGPARTRPTADPGQLRGRPPHPGPAYPLHPCSQARCSISTVPWTAKCASSPTSAASVSANWSGSRTGSGCA